MIIRLYIYNYIYIYVYVYSSCHLVVGVFARQMHSTSEFTMPVLSKCVNHLNRCKTCTTSRTRGAQKAHRAELEVWGLKPWKFEVWTPQTLKFGTSNLGSFEVWTIEGFEPYHNLALNLWMHQFSLTSPPEVPYFMRAPVLGQVWVFRVPR